MADQPPPKPESLLKNPQIVATTIGGIITLIVAIVGVLPTLLKNDPPTPAATIVIVIATQIPPTATTEAATITPGISPATQTSIPPTATENIQPTNTPPPEPTQLPTATNPPAPTAAPNVLLIYDDVSFTLINQSGQTLSLEGIFFRSTAGEWEARRWGPSIYNSLPDSKCLRLRDSTAGSRQPPAPCRGNNLFGLIEVGTSALFWVGVDSFDVVLNDAIIATCTLSNESCGIAIP